MSLENHTVKTWSRGITSDGTYIYSSVYTISTPNGTIIKYETDANEISRIHIPLSTGYLVGLTWDGSYLWAFQSTPQSLLQINPTSGVVLKNI